MRLGVGWLQVGRVPVDRAECSRRQAPANHSDTRRSPPAAISAPRYAEALKGCNPVVVVGAAESRGLPPPSPTVSPRRERRTTPRVVNTPASMSATTVREPLACHGSANTGPALSARPTALNEAPDRCSRHWLQVLLPEFDVKRITTSRSPEFSCLESNAVHACCGRAKVLGSEFRQRLDSTVANDHTLSPHRVARRSRVCDGITVHCPHTIAGLVPGRHRARCIDRCPRLSDSSGLVEQTRIHDESLQRAEPVLVVAVSKVLSWCCVSMVSGSGRGSTSACVTRHA